MTATATGTCVPNIGPRERRRRRIGGLVMAAIAAVAAAVLVMTDAPRLWRVLLFLPIAGAALGLFQVHAKTCVALAARGVRNMDSGDEVISDQHELARVRAQARDVYLKALIAALLVTGLVLVA